MKLYVCNSTKNKYCNGEGLYYLIAESGELLDHHWCSDKWFAKGDLYINRLEKIREYAEKYGECECLFLGDDDMTQEKLIELNRQFCEKESSNAGQT